MATFNASTYLKGTKLRPSNQFDPEESTFSITIPGSTESGATYDSSGNVVAGPVITLATGDVFNFGRLGGNVNVLSVEFDIQNPLTSANAPVTVGTNASAGNFISQTYASGLKVYTATNGGTPAFAAVFVPSASDLILKATLGTLTGTQTTEGTLDRTLVLRVKYQYAYPERVASGAPNTYPGSGSIRYSAPISQTFNGNAP